MEEHEAQGGRVNVVAHAGELDMMRATDYTAFDHIVGRLQGGGWKYIKVESITEI